MSKQVLVAVIFFILGVIVMYFYRQTTNLSSVQNNTVTNTTNPSPISTSNSIPNPTPSTELNSSHSNKSLPKFNPNTYLCDNMTTLSPSKSNPDFNPNKYSWQTSAPRGTPGKTFKGEVVSVGLRNKYGNVDDIFYFTARVEQPDGVATTADKYLKGTEWSYLNFPTDFNGGNTNKVGIYTVIYQIHGTIVSCDGFVVNE